MHWDRLVYLHKHCIIEVCRLQGNTNRQICMTVSLSYVALYLLLFVLTIPELKRLNEYDFVYHALRSYFFSQAASSLLHRAVIHLAIPRVKAVKFFLRWLNYKYRGGNMNVTRMERETQAPRHSFSLWELPSTFHQVHFLVKVLAVLSQTSVGFQ